MQRTLISAGIAAAFALCGTAFAGTPITAAQGDAAAVKVFLSGASANATTIRNAAKLALCGGTASTNFNEYTINSSDGFAVTCNDGTNDVAFFYTALGSAFGAQTVYYNGAGVATPRIDLTSCNEGTKACSAWTTNANSPVPDAGITDVSPVAFTLSKNVPSTAALDREFNSKFGGSFSSAYPALYTALSTASTDGDIGSITVSPVNGMAFHIIASEALQTLLGASTLNTAPVGNDFSVLNVSRATVTGILRGDYTGTTVFRALGVTAPTTTNATKFAVCRRVSTSGTQAWANTYFLGTGADAPKGENATDLGATVTGSWRSSTGAAQSFAVVENVTTGNLRACMLAASVQGIPAIGIISGETSNRPTGTLRYNFLRLDGVAADGTTANDKVNIRNGYYDYVGEATMNVRPGLSSAVDAALTAIRADLTSSAVCTTSGVATGGVTTMPDGSSGNASGCEQRWSRKGSPFNKPGIRSGE